MWPHHCWSAPYWSTSSATWVVACMNMSNNGARQALPRPPSHGGDMVRVQARPRAPPPRLTSYKPDARKQAGWAIWPHHCWSAPFSSRTWGTWVVACVNMSNNSASQALPGPPSHGQHRVELKTDVHPLPLLTLGDSVCAEPFLSTCRRRPLPQLGPESCAWQSESNRSGKSQSLY